MSSTLIWLCRTCRVPRFQSRSLRTFTVGAIETQHKETFGASDCNSVLLHAHIAFNIVLAICLKDEYVNIITCQYMLNMFMYVFFMHVSLLFLFTVCFSFDFGQRRFTFLNTDKINDCLLFHFNQPLRASMITFCRVYYYS